MTNAEKLYLEVRLSGSGGQGLIKAGVILAEAAILDGKNAVQSQSYGPEARGGASKSEVIVSNEEIIFPKARELNILLALTQQSCDKYYADLKNGALLVVDSSKVLQPPHIIDLKLAEFPITEEAIKLGNVMVANIIALAIICELTKIVSKTSLKKAVEGNVPARFMDVNNKALNAGYRLARNYLKAQSEDEGEE